MDYIILILEVLAFLGILFLAMLKKNYFPKYLEEKAKNAASKEDIQIITAQIEDVTHKYKVQFDEIQKKNDVFFDEIKQSNNRFNTKQFELYNELWSSLIDLKVSADELWDSATISKLKDFSNKVYQAHISIQKSALLIEEAHYKKLMDIMKKFKEFEFGKKSLISLRNKTIKEIGQIDLYGNAIELIISNNRSAKQEYDDLLLELKKQFIKQIRGKNI